MINLFVAIAILLTFGYVVIVVGNIVVGIQDLVLADRWQDRVRAEEGRQRIRYAVVWWLRPLRDAARGWRL